MYVYCSSAVHNLEFRFAVILLVNKIINNRLSAVPNSAWLWKLLMITCMSFIMQPFTRNDVQIDCNWLCQTKIFPISSNTIFHSLIMSKMPSCSTTQIRFTYMYRYEPFYVLFADVTTNKLIMYGMSGWGYGRYLRPWAAPYSFLRSATSISDVMW